jgi:hypothetical protein
VLTVQLGAQVSAPAETFEGVIDQLLDSDPNSSGFMRKPVRAVFVDYAVKRWEAAAASCPALSLLEYRAVRFYSENYYREINSCLREGFLCPMGRPVVEVTRRTPLPRRPASEYRTFPDIFATNRINQPLLIRGLRKKLSSEQ